MNEAQIERVVECRMNLLDNQYLSGCVSEEEYTLSAALLAKWADEALSLCKN